MEGNEEVTLIITFSIPFFFPNRLMINVSEKAKQLLPKVLEEKNDNSSLPLHLGPWIPNVTNWEMKKKQTKAPILKPIVLIPISVSRIENQLEHSSYLKSTGFACLEIIACCTVPGVHGAGVGTSKMELCSIWPPTAGYSD